VRVSAGGDGRGRARVGEVRKNGRLRQELHETVFAWL